MRGGLMWVAVTFAYLVPAVIITMRLLSDGRTSARQLYRSTM